jgi:hypothetical protein
MADLLQSGLAWLHRQRKASMTTAAVYTRAGESTGSALAVAASQIRVEMLDGQGFPVQAAVMDFICDVADLAAEPANGDGITYDGRSYVVTPLGDEPCFRFTDASRLAYRIHTRDVGASES